MPEAPKVFISYSHDSQEQMDRVLALSDRLRKEGLDCRIDQYEQSPPEGWPQWCARQVEQSEFVLVACAETYLRRFKGEETPGKGLGGTWEGHIITQELYNAQGKNNRFVPIIFSEQDAAYVPIILQGATRYAILEGYEPLYRRLTNQPLITMPTLGAVKPMRAREGLPSLPKLERKQDFVQAWNVPYPRNPFFTGREKVLEALGESLERRGAAALSGLGGVGKTETAVEYAYRHRNNYNFVFWAKAESRDTLVWDFASIAAVLSLPESTAKEQEAAVSAVKRWLENNAAWLLVLDNADDLPMVREFIPHDPQGHILLTTSAQAASAIAERVEIEEMEREEGALFLLRRAGVIVKDAQFTAANQTDRELAKQISQELVGLPLALDQAGAFIEETPSSLAEYIELYRSEGAKLRAKRGGLGDHPSSVTFTFSLAFQKVAPNSPAAADLIRVCAFLAPDAIPEEVFTEGAAELGDNLRTIATSPFDFTQALEEAGRFSLIDRNSQKKTLDIHRLVQEVVNDGRDEAEQRRWAERAVRAVARAFPSPEFPNWAQCERLLSHAQACGALIEEFGFDLEEAALLLNQAGSYLHQRARYAEAAPLIQRSLAIREKALGPDHPAVALSLNNLALLYDSQGKYAEAEPLYQRSLAITEEALGPEHPAVAVDLNNLAALYCSQGKYAEAAPLFQRVLAMSKKAQGPDQPHVALSLNSLAEFYHSQGKYAEAEPLVQRALAIEEKAHGPDHPDVALSLNNLALLYYDQGKYAEAEPLHQRSLAIWEKALGPDHPDVARGLDNLAALYCRQGKYAEADPLVQRALAIKEKALGPEHRDVALSLNNLALLYRDQGKYAEAAPLYQRSLAIWEEVLGPDHPDVAQGLNNLAGLYFSQGKYAEAEPLYQRSLAIMEKALGPDHANVARSLNNLALLYCDQRKYAEAEPLFQRSLAIREKALGPDHPDVATVLDNYAVLLLKSWHPVQGARMAARAVAIRARHKSQNPLESEQASPLELTASLIDLLIFRLSSCEQEVMVLTIALRAYDALLFKWQHPPLKERRFPLRKPANRRALLVQLSVPFFWRASRKIILRFENSPQVSLVERNQIIQTFAADGSDQAFAEGVRLGGAEGRFQDFQTHRL
jgi:tetratricopeptide (TPR) repeat protein